jgi:hypothetical protein
MWTTGARIPEVLALTPSHLIDDGYNFMVVLRALKQRSVRPTNVQRAGSAKRAEPSLS